MGKNFKFQGRLYNSNQGWGYFHPKHSYWYDPSCINIDNDVAVLDIRDGAYADKKYGAGQMVSKKHYLYGTFEWEYLLPKGRNLWPAIWLTAVESWPPEIDVMEGWTSRGLFKKYRSDYKRSLCFNNIVPGVFFGSSEDKKHWSKASLGSKTTFSWLQPIDKVNKCRLEWTPEYIKVYYNDVLVSKLDDKEILKEFNKPMMMIMNNAVTNEFNESDYIDYKKNGRPFSILSFKYSEYEDC